MYKLVLPITKILRPVKKTIRFFHFGRVYAFWQFLYEFNHKFHRVPGNYIINHRHAAILKYLSVKYAPLINSFTNISNDDPSVKEPQPPVWFCWWQGIENMPPLVRACYNSVLKKANNHPVNLVTRDNYDNFVVIPDIIIKKLNSGIMTLTHFSNILRMTLLYEYGGLWIDATILTTEPLPEYCFDAELFSLRRMQEGDNVSLCRWTAFLFGGRHHNIFFCFMKNFFFEYWNNETSMPDYHLVDYMIATAYDQIPSVKAMIDSIPHTNPHLYYITEHLNDAFDDEIFNNICKDTCFHKLSHKKTTYEYTGGRLTFYGYILINFLNNFSP